MALQTPKGQMKTFTVQKKNTDVNGRGRQTAAYAADGTIKGYLAEAREDVKERWNQLGHPVTHTITGQGSPAAKAGYIITLGTRKFYVQGTDGLSELGLWTLYFVEERFDTKGA